MLEKVDIVLALIKSIVWDTQILVHLNGSACEYGIDLGAIQELYRMTKGQGFARIPKARHWLIPRLECFLTSLILLFMRKCASVLEGAAS